MTILYGNSGTMPGAGSRNHHDLLDELRKGQREMDVYSGMMTPYEVESVKRDIIARRERYRDAIVKGVTDEWQAALDGVKAAQAGRHQAIEHEAQRWDSAKLATELTAARHLVELAKQRGDDTAWGGTSPDARMAAIIQDAQASRDIHRLRATAEVIAAESTGVMPGVANKLLRAIRDTDEIHETRDAELTAIHALQDTREMMLEAAQLIGEPAGGVMSTGVLNQAVKRARFTDHGVDILAADDPEVTGVIIHWEGGQND